MTSVSDPAVAGEQHEFVGPGGGGYYWTVIRDWIALCPDLSDVEVRLYDIIRSLITERGDRRRSLTVDELCWLLPGPGGKPTSPTRCKDALRSLQRVGLLSDPDGGVTRRWVTRADGTRSRANFRRWQVHDLPPDADAYTGWRSAMQKLDAYPGPGWRDQPAPEGRNSAFQARPAETRVCAGQHEGRNSVAPGRNSDSYRPVTCGDAPPQVTDTSNPPLPPHAEQAPHEPRTAVGEGGTHTENEPAGGQPQPVTDISPPLRDATVTGGHLDAAHDLLASLPPPWRPGRGFQRQHAHLAALALEDGWDPDALARRLIRTEPDKGPVRDHMATLLHRLQRLPVPTGDGGDPDAPLAAAAVETPVRPCPVHGDGLVERDETRCRACLGELRARGVRGADWHRHGSTPHAALDALTREARDAA